MTAVERLASLLAAISHDLDHPGTNQSFLIATSNPLVPLYQVLIGYGVFVQKQRFICYANIGSCAASFKQPYLSLSVSVYLCVALFGQL